MNKIKFQNELEFSLGISFNARIKHLEGSPIFFEKILMMLKKAIRERTFIKLTEEKYKKFLQFENKEILAESERFCMYRIAGKLYLNRLVESWETARIY